MSGVLLSKKVKISKKSIKWTRVNFAQFATHLRGAPHDRVLHVPLAFRWPGDLVRGESFAPVQLVDVMPTILDLAGIGAPADLDGRSLAATLRGGSAPQRPAYSEQRSARGECLQLALPQHCRLDRFAVQTERWKLVTSFQET